MMWWDTRRLGEPTDTLQLATDSKGGGMVLGGSSMEYNQEAGPTKYLVGTEQGIVLQVGQSYLSHWCVGTAGRLGVRRKKAGYSLEKQN